MSEMLSSPSDMDSLGPFSDDSAEKKKLIKDVLASVKAGGLTRAGRGRGRKLFKNNDLVAPPRRSMVERALRSSRRSILPASSPYSNVPLSKKSFEYEQLVSPILKELENTEKNEPAQQKSLEKTQDTDRTKNKMSSLKKLARGGATTMTLVGESDDKDVGNNKENNKAESAVKKKKIDNIKNICHALLDAKAVASDYSIHLDLDQNDSDLKGVERAILRKSTRVQPPVRNSMKTVEVQTSLPMQDASKAKTPNSETESISGVLGNMQPFICHESNSARLFNLIVDDEADKDEESYVPKSTDVPSKDSARLWNFMEDDDEANENEEAHNPTTSDGSPKDGQIKPWRFNCSTMHSRVTDLLKRQSMSRGLSETIAKLSRLNQDKSNLETHKTKSFTWYQENSVKWPNVHSQSALQPEPQVKELNVVLDKLQEPIKSPQSSSKSSKESQTGSNKTAVVSPQLNRTNEEKHEKQPKEKSASRSRHERHRSSSLESASPSPSRKETGKSSRRLKEKRRRSSSEESEYFSPHRKQAITPTTSEHILKSLKHKSRSSHKARQKRDRSRSHKHVSKERRNRSRSDSRHSRTSSSSRERRRRSKSVDEILRSYYKSSSKYRDKKRHHSRSHFKRHYRRSRSSSYDSSSSRDRTNRFKSGKSRLSPSRKYRSRSRRPRSPTEKRSKSRNRRDRSESMEEVSPSPVRKQTKSLKKKRDRSRSTSLKRKSRSRDRRNRSKSSCRTQTKQSRRKSKSRDRLNRSRSLDEMPSPCRSQTKSLKNKRNRSRSASITKSKSRDRRDHSLEEVPSSFVPQEPSSPRRQTKSFKNKRNRSRSYGAVSKSPQRQERARSRSASPIERQSKSRDKLAPSSPTQNPPSTSKSLRMTRSVLNFQEAVPSEPFEEVPFTSPKPHVSRSPTKRPSRSFRNEEVSHSPRTRQSAVQQNQEKALENSSNILQSTSYAVRDSFASGSQINQTQAPGPSTAQIPIIVVTVPKKRGRKPKNFSQTLLDTNSQINQPQTSAPFIALTPNELPKVPKKRGRKPKNASQTIINTNSQIDQIPTSTSSIASTSNELPNIPKKRGRKPKNASAASSDSNVLKVPFPPRRRNLIFTPNSTNQSQVSTRSSGRCCRPPAPKLYHDWEPKKKVVRANTTRTRTFTSTTSSSVATTIPEEAEEVVVVKKKRTWTRKKPVGEKSVLSSISGSTQPPEEPMQDAAAPAEEPLMLSSDLTTQSNDVGTASTLPLEPEPIVESTQLATIVNNGDVTKGKTRKSRKLYSSTSLDLLSSPKEDDKESVSEDVVFWKISDGLAFNSPMVALTYAKKKFSFGYIKMKPNNTKTIPWDCLCTIVRGKAVIESEGNSHTLSENDSFLVKKDELCSATNANLDDSLLLQFCRFD